MISSLGPHQNVMSCNQSEENDDTSVPIIIDVSLFANDTSTGVESNIV